MTSYRNIPVYRGSSSSLDANDPRNIVGKARVDVNDKDKSVVVTVESVNTDIVDFLELGDLKAFYLGAFLTEVDPKKAKEYWSTRQ